MQSSKIATLGIILWMMSAKSRTEGRFKVRTKPKMWFTIYSLKMLLSFMFKHSINNLARNIVGEKAPISEFTVSDPFDANYVTMNEENSL